MTVAPYSVLRAPRHEILRLRGLDIHLLRWGPHPKEAEPPIVMLHGWLDTADTFQFLVDAFERDWPLVALDWRGFGRSEWPQEGYWFPDYYADLDALLDALSPSAPARIIGHSMGANIATQYAGLRPDRVRCLANLEGFGLPRGAATDTPRVLRRWMDQVKSPPKPRYYASLEQLAEVIAYRYPRFSAAQAAFIAAAWSTPDGDRVRLLGDGRHRWTNPVRFNREDAEACWREARAPMLLVMGEESEYPPKLKEDGTDEALHRAFGNVKIVRVAGVGHMLHIEPELLL